MKKALLSVPLCFLYLFSAQAQSLYGTTLNGGNNGGGTIIRFLPATNSLTVPESSESIPSNPYYTNFVRASDGKIYGMTSVGGNRNVGTIFSFDPSSSIYTKLMDFDTANGANPYGSLIQAIDGKLFGMTKGGGNSDVGVIFSFDPSTATYAKLYDFDTTSGANPYGSLLQAKDGKLYGMTFGGGSRGGGVIFSFDPSASTYTKLYDFDSTNGANPYGSLIQATDGKLYGMTRGGGIGYFYNGINLNAGVIFSFDPSSSTYKKLLDFDYLFQGGHPYGDLVQAGDGKLYGMTNEGGINSVGVLFSFDPSLSAYIKLMDFDNTIGAGPYGSLILTSDGKFYGVTRDGGSNFYGVIFSFDPSSSAYTKLYDFDNTNGADPYGSLLQTSDGKLYGMTNGGGSGFFGVIFSFDPLSSNYTKLKEFGINENGSNVVASLMPTSDGKLYGMTANGGSAGAGVIFSIDPSASTYTKLHDFDNTNGAHPFGRLVAAGDGKLYGVTAGGGSSGAGVIFSFDPAASTFTKLKDFDNTIGASPYGSLVQASNGKLYGMTSSGSVNNYGVIFSFDPSSSTYTKLMDFDNANGSNSWGSLVEAGNGKLYGMTNGGGSNFDGVIFSFDPSSSTYTKLKDFDNANGAFPYGNSLVQANDGKLYGMTNGGGSSNLGVIFSFDISSSAYTKLKDFDSTNGSNPNGNFIQASDGKLYGMTYHGGSSNYGVIFSYDPSSLTYAKLKDFDYVNGANPYFGSAFIEVTDALPVTLVSFSGKNNRDINHLSWKAANEQNLDYYELQRSIDGQNFKGIHQVKAAGNNSYTYNDHIAAMASSIYYYRLKIVDKDVNFKYSAIIKLRTAINEIAIANPNPFKNKLEVNIESFIKDKAAVVITDIRGRQLYKEEKMLAPGTNVIEINDAARLSKGTYLVTIISSKQKQTLKIVKQ